MDTDFDSPNNLYTSFFNLCTSFTFKMDHSIEYFISVHLQNLILASHHMWMVNKSGIVSLAETEGEICPINESFTKPCCVLEGLGQTAVFPFNLERLTSD